MPLEQQKISLSKFVGYKSRALKFKRNCNDLYIQLYGVYIYLQCLVDVIPHENSSIILLTMNIIEPLDKGPYLTLLE